MLALKVEVFNPRNVALDNLGKALVMVGALGAAYYFGAADAFMSYWGIQKHYEITQEFLEQGNPNWGPINQVPVTLWRGPTPKEVLTTN